MIDLLQAAGMLVTGAIAIASLILAFRLLRGNPIEYERNRQRTGSLKAALSGQVPTVSDGTRDYRVAAGIAVDRRSNEWVEQGRLSTEAIAAALRQSLP